MALSQRLFTIRGMPRLALWMALRAQGVNDGPSRIRPQA